MPGWREKLRTIRFKSYAADGYSPSQVFGRVRAALSHGPILRNIAGAGVLQLALLVSGVLSARLLGPENRGYLALLTAWLSTVSQLGAVGISLAATFYLASGRINGGELIAILRRPALIQLVILVAVYAVIIGGYTLISGAPILIAAILSLVQVPAGLAFDYGLALTLGGSRHGPATAFRTVAPLLLAGELVILYTLHVDSLAMVAAAASASAAVAGALALTSGIRTARSIKVKVSLLDSLDSGAARKQILAFGRRGYLGYLSPTDSFRLDQLVVGLLLSPRVLGIYVVGAAFTNFTRLVAVNVGMSATPEVAKLKDPAQAQQLVKRTLLISSGLVAMFTIALGMLALAAIPFLFGSQFDAAVPIAEVLLVVGGLLSIKRIAVDLLRGAGYPQLGTRAEALTLTIFAALCVPAGLTLGGIGVAGSLLVAALCGFFYLLEEMRVHTFGD